jgi:hypothetical protein
MLSRDIANMTLQIVFIAVLNIIIFFTYTTYIEKQIIISECRRIVADLLVDVRLAVSPESFPTIRNKILTFLGSIINSEDDKRIQASNKELLEKTVKSIIFLVILGSILLVKYKGKLTPSEKEIKNREKHYYIISKIKNYQEMKLMNQQNLITGLPRWDNEYDLLHNK